MNIGIDIDDTITNSSEVFVKYAKKYNKEKNINYNINTFELDKNKAFGWTLENQVEFSKLYLKRILKEAIPNENVVDIIKLLKKRGYKIIFITARNDTEVNCMYEFTKKWLEKNDIHFDKLIVNCSDKLKEVIENNIDLFIDDNYFNCKNIFDNCGIPVFMYKTVYNEKYVNTPFNIVNNWKEILNLVNGLYFNK